MLFVYCCNNDLVYFFSPMMPVFFSLVCDLVTFQWQRIHEPRKEISCIRTPQNAYQILLRRSVDVFRSCTKDHLIIFFRRFCKSCAF